MRIAARICCTALLVSPLACLFPARAAHTQELDVSHISLDSLLAVPVHAAARYAQAVAYAPASVSIVTAAEIEALGMRTLGDVLSAVPGMYLSDDRNYAYVGVRGFSRPSDYNNRLLVLLNGHPMNENTYGSAFVGLETPIDMGIVERVEVVRGPASALYGSNAMLAVVNIVTAHSVPVSTYVEAGSHRSVRAGGRWAGDLAGGRFLADAQAWIESGHRSLGYVVHAELWLGSASETSSGTS
jgi:outer membrane receptor for ferrienterochelin and colicin